jgi:hypothetical protein
MRVHNSYSSSRPETIGSVHRAAGRTRSSTSRWASATTGLITPIGCSTLGADPGLPPIGRPQRRCRGAPMREVTRMECAHGEDGALPRVGRIASHAPLLAVPPPRQDLAVGDIGRRDFNGVNQLALAVDAEVPFHAEVPLAALSTSDACRDLACRSRARPRPGRRRHRAPENILHGGRFPLIPESDA